MQPVAIMTRLIFSVPLYVLTCLGRRACPGGSSVATDLQDGGRDSEGDVAEVSEVVLRAQGTTRRPDDLVITGV